MLAVCAQGDGRVTCPQHVRLVESEPLVPCPGENDFDEDEGAHHQVAASVIHA